MKPPKEILDIPQIQKGKDHQHVSESFYLFQAGQYSILIIEKKNPRNAHSDINILTKNGNHVTYFILFPITKLIDVCTSSCMSMCVGTRVCTCIAICAQVNGHLAGATPSAHQIVCGNET